MSCTDQLRIIPSMARVHAVRNSIIRNSKYTGQKVLIDFSSPNIAKPFHFGHLKSTILGNYLSNLNDFYGNKVVKINYVGDWGTQYGLLSLGLDYDKRASTILCDQNSKISLLEQLVDIYVEANKRGTEDQSFYESARQRFKMMDRDQDESQILTWRKIRDISLKELKHSYGLLGITFDAYEYESDYAKSSQDLIEQMKMRGLVKEVQNDSTAMLAVEVIKNDKLLEVPMLKSDGTSLYITRDTSAAISRHSRYNFDSMLYVAGADQERHFHCLFEILKKVTEQEWTNSLTHVKIGKVSGMSSRHGNFVLLSKILEEATGRFIESTKNTPTNKLSTLEDIEKVAEHLAMSTLFVYDMRNKRTRNYKFDWDEVMKPSDRSGLQIQGCHARLCNLREKVEEKRGLYVYDSTDEMDYSSESLKTTFTNDAIDLIGCLNEFHNHINRSFEAMDPCPIVNFAFRLSKITNRSVRNEFLHVLNEPNDKIAKSRLTLFDTSREILECILKLLGLKPLKKI